VSAHDLVGVHPALDSERSVGTSIAIGPCLSEETMSIPRPWEAVHALLTRLGTNRLTGQTVVIVGGSRGLGLDLARQLAAAGCKIAVCARDGQEVERVHRELCSSGAAVFAQRCDATRPDQVDDFIGATLRRFGSLDMLITCAATIQVGPLDSMSEGDVSDALEQIFWSAYYPTMAVLPHMRERKAGRIVHVSSFGGKLGVPHMLPYCTAKFALTGFSASLRTEVAEDGISVTTITPGLLRTGAHVNAPFKGQREKEYLWFSAGATLPFVSLPSATAARRILRAAARGDAESTLTSGIRLLVIANAVAPKLVSRLLSLQNRLLPSAKGGTSVPLRGMEVVAQSRSRLVHSVDEYGRANADEHDQYPGPVETFPPEPLPSPSTLLRAAVNQSA
jgi:NAD(P)-dependent dehydrogenase (short-subunit alcohol dehydrogenase family)